MLLIYIARRILQIIPLLLIITLIAFFIIQLPPGDYLTSVISQRRAAGTDIDEAEIINLTRMYNLDKPMVVQYLLWMKNIITKGDLGMSFQWGRPVTEVIGERLLITILISLSTLIFIWIVALPIGIYSATHQYSFMDYVFTLIGFIGISMPAFLIAIVLIYVVFVNTGIALTGLFSPDFQKQVWSWAKFINMLSRIWLPILILGLSGTAGLIRTTRAMMLDELRKQYVVTARAKGVRETRLLFKYPVRVAVNPMISTVGWLLPSLIAGETIVSIVLNLPTNGPVFLRALMCQDMYLAGGILLMISVLTVVGTLISDILLAVFDPRIRLGGKNV